jgi:xanthine dehydrogenase accessory factor
MELWNFVHNHLADNERVILIVVIDTRGSSPGRVGFKMAVAEKGDFFGSIGGGVMEYNMVERAHRLLAEKCSETIIKRQVHDPGAEHDKSGMICAGEQTHAFIPLTSAHLNDITGILECIAGGGTGILSITMKDFHFSGGETSDEPIVIKYNDEVSWEYKERIGLPDTVYIFGAGHISVPLSQILRMLNFRVVVFDDRKELSTFKANSYAHHKEIIDYKNIGNLVPEGPNSFVVIMSFGHKSDDVILRQMLAKKLGYLGMIGSKSKVGVIFDSLHKEGFTRENLSRVNSPIGIPIGSQTPAEIAISIAAKIIQTRNSKL